MVGAVSAFPSDWRDRLWRWRRWLVVAAVLVVIRVALPLVLRRVIASQASQALHARVEVGAVHLRLWRGGVALEDVAVRAADAPTPPPDAKPAPEAAARPAFDEYSPIIGFKHLAVELHYLPLFRKTIQLRDIQLESPRVALDRLANGDLNVQALVPKQEVAVKAGASPAVVATPTPTAGQTPGAASQGSAWRLGLDRFVLKDGRLRFRDLMLHGSEPVEVGIDQLSVDEIALTPEVYGEPARVHVKLGVDNGSIDVNARLKLVGGDVAVTTDVRAERLPLHRARLYVPKVGWTDLRGELNLDLTYELEPRQTNQLRGTLDLREVAVTVPKLEDVAVGWKILKVDLDTIDLLAQRAAVKEVALDGARLGVRGGGGKLQVLALEQGRELMRPTPGETPVAATATPAGLGGATPAAEAAEDSPTAGEPGVAATSTPTPTGGIASSPTAVSQVPPTPTAGATQPENLTPATTSGTPLVEAKAEPREPAKPWEWHVTTVKITDSTVRVLSDQPPADVGVNLTATNLAGAAGAVSHVALTLAGELGRIKLDGDLRIAPPAFGGTLAITDLSLPRLAAIYGSPPTALPSAALRCDLSIAAGLPAAAGSEAPADQLRVSGTVALADVHAAPPDAGLNVDFKGLDLRVDQLTVPGVIPVGQTAAAGTKIDLVGQLTLTEPHIVRAADPPLTVQMQSFQLDVPALSVPAAIARLGPGDGPQIVTANTKLELVEPRVVRGNDDATVQAHRLAVGVSDAAVPVLLPASPPAEGTAQAPTAAAPPLKVGVQLDLEQPRVATAQGKELVAEAQSIALKLADVVVPGFIAGLPPLAAGEPLHGAATLTLSEPRLARGDGKEFAVSAKSISVPLTDLLVPGSVGALMPTSGSGMTSREPLRAKFGDIRLDAPAVRVTRTQDGMVLPAAGAATPGVTTRTAAATPAPAAPVAPKPAIDVEVAALNVLRGGLDFTDRAVKPIFTTRLAPIEIGARNIHYPDLTVKPFKVEITNGEQQGRITIAGNLAPSDGAVDIEVTDLALVPLNPYVSTYSSYSIADGALSFSTKAQYTGGAYDVKNDLTLHQFDLSGGEGDSLFEQEFGISLTMALALLRDIQGNIDLAIPMQVDEKGGAHVDVITVVRSALRQALTGALTSPLKILGAVVGGKGAPVVPAPIAFRLGRAEPTEPGAEAADHLAAFLVGRPGMGVQLDTSPTEDDVRWLREQALGAQWEKEGFFERATAFLTQRGPRQRIRGYIEGRAANQRPELSAEDQATLQQWLGERPAPTVEELRALAVARVDVVETVLHDKGIDAARISHNEPSGEPVSGSPAVAIKLHPVGSSPTPKS